MLTPHDGKEFWIDRTARAIAYQGWNSLSVTEECSLKDNAEFREAVMKRLDEIQEREKEEIAAWKREHGSTP